MFYELLIGRTRSNQVNHRSQQSTIEREKSNPQKLILSKESTLFSNPKISEMIETKERHDRIERRRNKSKEEIISNNLRIRKLKLSSSRSNEKNEDISP